MKSGVGVGGRAGTPKPDISSSEALKKTVLAAKSIRYATRPSGVHMVALRVMATTHPPTVSENEHKGDVIPGPLREACRDAWCAKLSAFAPCWRPAAEAELFGFTAKGCSREPFRGQSAL